MKVVLNEHDLKVDAAQYIYSKELKRLLNMQRSV